jgi:tRNA-modifying protein YgfZ
MLSPGPVTFKANPQQDSLPALASHRLLVVEGPDAPAFLQAQLMNDVRALVPGQWQWNGWLSAKGRVIALMALLRTAVDRFVVVLPDYPPQELQARLQRYVFRSKVKLSVPADWCCAAQLDAEPAPDVDIARGDDMQGWRLEMVGEAGRRALWLLPADSPFLTAEDAGASAAWTSLDLAHGLPRLPSEGVEAWTPQMLSLERLRAFSLAKGCYPGQEIVARTHYLGKAKRGLLHVAGHGLRAGQALQDGTGVELGQLACATADGRAALAVAALERVDSPLRVDGREVERLPLSAGLARPL